LADMYSFVFVKRYQ